jgi:hypothetical protein
MKWIHLANAGKYSMVLPPSGKKALYDEVEDHRQHQAGDDRPPKRIKRIFHFAAPSRGSSAVWIQFCDRFDAVSIDLRCGGTQLPEKAIRL